MAVQIPISNPSEQKFHRIKTKDRANWNLSALEIQIHDDNQLQGAIIQVQACPEQADPPERVDRLEWPLRIEEESEKDETNNFIHFLEKPYWKMLQGIEEERSLSKVKEACQHQTWLEDKTIHLPNISNSMEEEQDYFWIPKSFYQETSFQSFRPPEDPISEEETIRCEDWAILREKNIEDQTSSSWSFRQLPEIWSNMQFGSPWKDSAVLCFRALAATRITDEVQQDCLWPYTGNFQEIDDSEISESVEDRAIPQKSPWFEGHTLPHIERGNQRSEKSLQSAPRLRKVPKREDLEGAAQLRILQILSALKSLRNIKMVRSKIKRQEE